MSAGVLSAISLAQETTWGTPVTPTKTVAVHPGDGIQSDQAVQFPTGIKGLLAKNNTGSFKGAATHEGEYELDLIPGYIGYFLKSALGGLSSALKGGESIVYNHTLTESATKTPLTVEQAIAELCYRFNGVIATGFTLSNKPGEPLVAKFPVKAKGLASATAITPALETARPFNFNDLGSTGIKIAGASVDEITSIEVEYRNNIEFKHSLASGGNGPNFNFLKASEALVKLEMYLNSTSAAEFVNYLNKTTQSFQLTFTGDTIGSSSNYVLDIVLPKVTWKVAKFPVTDDYNLVSIEGEAEYDTATSKLISGVLTNLTAAYS